MELMPKEQRQAEEGPRSTAFLNLIQHDGNRYDQIGGRLPIFIGRPQFNSGGGEYYGSGLPIFVGRPHYYGSGCPIEGDGFWTDIAQGAIKFFKPLFTSDTAKYLAKKGLKASLGVAKDT